MGRNILFLSALCLLFIFETTAVQMCAKQSSSSKNVNLNLNKGTDSSGCNCSVKLDKTENIGSNRSKIIFETVQFSGCKYKLVISYNNTSSKYGCSYNNQSIFHNINKTDEIKLYLESTTSQDESTTFEVRITSSVTANDPWISLGCNGTITETETTTSTVTMTSLISTLSSTSNSTHKSAETSTITSTQVSSPVSISNSSSVLMNQSISTAETLTSTGTQISNKPATGNAINETKTGGATNPGGDDIDIGIIGGAVGGGLLLIILIIIIIVCVVKKRRKEKHEKKDYNRPTVTGPQHDYTDIDLVAKDNNSSSRQSDNMDQKANSPVVMEIIENDLYVSSDDIMDSKSRDYNNTNQKKDASDSKSRDNNNTNQKTDANNGPAENSTSRDNGGPLYAVVNKKPKSRKSDQTDKSNGIAGYTDSDLGTKDNNSSSRQPDNAEQNTNSSIAIEMDPKSRDDNNTNQKTDAMDSKSRVDNNTNQKTDAKNGPAEREVIENDLYVSSGEALNSHDNDGPLYSSVNKKPKSPISNQADSSNNGEDHDTLL